MEETGGTGLTLLHCYLLFHASPRANVKLDSYSWDRGAVSHLKALVCITVDHLVLNNTEPLLLLNSQGKLKCIIFHEFESVNINFKRLLFPVLGLHTLTQTAFSQMPN